MEDHSIDIVVTYSYVVHIRICHWERATIKQTANFSSLLYHSADRQ